MGGYSEFGNNFVIGQQNRIMELFPLFCRDRAMFNKYYWLFGLNQNSDNKIFVK